MKHSPLPWRSGNLVTNDGSKAIMSDGGRVATFHSPDPDDQHSNSDSIEREANIDLALKAVNHHQELVDMVEVLRHIAMPYAEPHITQGAKALLAKIKESE